MRKLLHLTVASLGVALLPITGIASETTTKHTQLAAATCMCPCRCNSPSVPLQTPSVSVPQGPSGMNGGYVCYDSRRVAQENDGSIVVNYWTNGANGCIRSGLPCARMDKNQFGFYPSESQARRALNRCAAGTPKNLD